MAQNSRPVPILDIVDRLKAAAEHDAGIPPTEAQALFHEAEHAIELLRSLLEPATEGGLEEIKPEGSA